MQLRVFLAAVSVFLLVFGVSWTKRNAFNFIVKLLFLGLGGWGVFLFLVSIGYVTKQ